MGQKEELKANVQEELTGHGNYLEMKVKDKSER